MALTKLSSFILANTGVTYGTYGGSTPWQSMTLSVNPEGQITSIANVTPSSLVASGSATSNIIVLATSVATDVVNTYAHAYTTGLFVANTDQSIQVGVQNFANTQNASADFALYNNLGTDTSNYVDLGIISQNYNTTINSFTAANPGDAYLYSNGSNMLIGAYTAGKAIKFFVNGYNAANVGVVINAPNTVSTTTSTGTMTIAGGLGVSGNVNIGGTITGTLAGTGVSAGTYGGATSIPVLVVNAGGQITSASNVSVTSGTTITNESSSGSTYYPILTTATSGTISAANTSSSGLSYVPSTGTLSATVHTSTSDRNLKENITVIDDALNIVKGIDGIRFNWKDNHLPSAGLLAQQVAQFLPELVMTDDKNNLSLNYNGVIGVLVQAIKELSAEVDQLKSNK